MHVLVIKVVLHVGSAQSLKAKRSVIQSVVRTIDGWKGVAVAEVGALDKWQRAELGVSVVAGSPAHAEEVADSVERHLWSVADTDVVECERSWWEDPNG